MSPHTTSCHFSEQRWSILVTAKASQGLVYMPTYRAAPGLLRPHAPEAPEPARSQSSGGDGGSRECAGRCSGMRTGRAAMETVHRPAWCRHTPSAGLEPSPTVAPGFLRETERFSRCCLLRRVRALRPASDCLEVAGTEVQATAVTLRAPKVSIRKRC